MESKVILASMTTPFFARPSYSEIGWIQNYAQTEELQDFYDCENTWMCLATKFDLYLVLRLDYAVC